MVLRHGQALLGGQAVPPDGFRVIPRHAFAGAVRKAEVVLRAGVSLLGVPGGLCSYLPCPEIRICLRVLGGQAEPPDGFRGVLRHAQTGAVLHPEGVLRLGGASLGEGAQVGKFLC